jgi:xanthine dehydrogenase YagS FAD-binding subunit
MRPFIFERAADVSKAAVSAAANSGQNSVANMSPKQFLAGGTTILDLMKLDVMRPEVLIDINPLDKTWSNVEVKSDSLRLGALAKMSDVADHLDIKREYPIIAQSLQLAASQQIRNMATLGGNVLQRTRCTYFRDVGYANCNKRNPGSGCAAREGFNRTHAILGASDQCIATYPGDFAQALLALDARVEIVGSKGQRVIGFQDLHKLPAGTPHIETSLAPGDLITGFTVQGGARRRSVYLKIRDRESYEFALASAAVVLDIQGGTIRNARIALGGVATAPWRATDAENVLNGHRYTQALGRQAAELAFRGAQETNHNKFKIELGKQTVMRALECVSKMEI